MATKDAGKTGKRKRRTTVSTASTLQAKALFAATRDELREIQTDLERVADERKALLAKDVTGRKSMLTMLPPSEKKS